MILNTTENVENVYKTLIEESPTPIALYVGKDMTIAMANEAMINAYGKDRSVIGKPFREAVPEFEGQGFFSILEQVFLTGIPYTSEGSAAEVLIDGELKTFYYSFTYKPLMHPDGTVWGIINTARNNTEQVLSKKASERAEEMLRLAVDSAELGTWFVDGETRVLQASPRTKQLFGYYAHENMPFDAAIHQIPPEHQERVTSAIDSAITKGESYDIEYPVVGFHNKKLRWLRVTGKLYQDEENKTSFLAGTVLDITDRKESEQRKDEFISVASHELKTPLTSLNAGFQLLERHFKAEPSLSEKLREIFRSTKANLRKINLLVDDLLNVTKIENGQLQLTKKWFTIADLVAECCDHVRLEGKHDLQIQGDRDVEVLADQQKIDQVVVNFVNNAVKYAPDSKVIIINIENLPDHVKLSVTDFGIGIDQDKVKQIFNRFYQIDQNRQHFSGLGLGLYISSEIIKHHGGEIGVESEPGQGSTFWFTLPKEKAVTG
jgi:PAS domain S-box-containing protein